METKLGRTVKAPSEAGLNLLWPGAAQIAQGRKYRGLSFGFAAAAVCGLWPYAADDRLAVSIALALVTAASLADACLFERRQVRAG